MFPVLSSAVLLAGFSRTGLYAVGAGLAAFALILGLLVLLQDGKANQIKQAPGLDLLLPNSTLFDDQTTGSIGNAGAYQMRAYGTNLSTAQILAFYDAELGKVGYRPTAPTPDTLFREDTDKLLRQYQNPPFTYRLYIFPLPRRVGGHSVRSGYQHILYTKLSN